MPQTITIFLASSEELKDDREKFEQFIGRKNKILNEHGQFIKLVIWEDFIVVMSKTRLQDEYNKAIRESDIFVMLFANKVGKYTREEFETAFGQFKETNKPRIYTYFKKAPVIVDDIPREDIQSLWDFQDRLKILGHFWTKYDNSDDLIYQFNEQLEKLTVNGLKPTYEHLREYLEAVREEHHWLTILAQNRKVELDKFYLRLQLSQRYMSREWEAAMTESPNRRQNKSAKKGTEIDNNDLDIHTALKRFTHIVIIGDPGSGKTTSLRRLASEYAALNLTRLSTGKEPELLPIYIPLGIYGGTDKSLKDYLLNVTRAYALSDSVAESLEHCVLDGQALLLFDGLDEVPTESRPQVARFFEGIMNRFTTHPIVITSRVIGFEDSLPGMILEVLPLALAQIEHFIKAWFVAIDREVDGLVLYRRITTSHQYRLFELAKNPFLLSLIALIFEEGKPLPERRVELYNLCIITLLELWDKKRGLGSRNQFARTKKEDLLMELALYFFETETSALLPIREVIKQVQLIINRLQLGCESEAILTEIEQNSGLFRKVSYQHYAFVHRTLFEYFVAWALVVKNDEKTRLNDYYNKYGKDPRWSEIFRLATGLLKKPTEFLKRVFNNNPTLGARCYLDAHPDMVDHKVIQARWAKIEPQQRIEIIQNVKNRWRETEDKPKEIQDALDFITFIFRVPETDCKVLYYCDELLATIGTEDAIELSWRMFDHWSAERQYITYEVEFKQDLYWKANDIPAGEFMMGGVADDYCKYNDEKPIHPVKLTTYRMGCYPVTVGQYHRFAPGHRKEKLNDEFGEDERQPVVRVTWFDAYVFCKWAHGRLPTEAEWEYACRADTTTPFNTGKGLNISQANYNEEIGKTTLVGSYKPNQWGLYDMHGNVFEWCQDWYVDEYYNECKGQRIVNNAQGPETGLLRVLRGGSWRDFARHCRSSYRNNILPEGRSDDIGFRLVFVPVVMG